MDRKPKVLILYDYYVPAYKAGGPVQSLANLVEMLGDKVDMYVLTGAYDLFEKEPMENISFGQWVKVEKAQVYYTTIISTSMVNRVVTEVKPDILYLNGMFSFPLMVYPVMKFFRRKKIILAPRGMLAPAALNIKKWKKFPYLMLLRLLGLQKKVTFHASKEVEVKEIREHFSTGCRIIKIGNVPFPPKEKFDGVAPKEGKPFHLYTVARISPEKNVHYVFEVLKNHQSDFPINLHIIGNPENDIYTRHCYGLEKTLPESVSVDWIGHLDQPDIRSNIKDYHLFFFPTLGENFGHAIFEALGAGKPVLISDRTPWHGLEEAKAGFELSLDDPDVWLEKIHFFVGMDEKTYGSWSRGAWEYARNYYEKQDLKKQYLEMFSV